MAKKRDDELEGDVGEPVAEARAPVAGKGPPDAWQVAAVAWEQRIRKLREQAFALSHAPAPVSAKG